MWINWTHEAAFAKSRLTENSVGCVASQHNYIAVQFRYKLGHGSVNSTVGHGGALAVLGAFVPRQRRLRLHIAGGASKTWQNHS